MINSRRIYGVTCSMHGKIRNTYKILVRKDQGVGDADTDEKIIKNEISD
jgi:hypothetical protein